MTTAALYARISLDKSGQALGVERQLRDLREMATTHGWDSVEYIDNSVSAYRDHARRPAFDAMLADAKAGRVQVIAAWATDRLARHPKALERLIDVCEAKDVPVHTVQAAVLDLTSPQGRAVARTVNAWAAFEVEHKSARQTRKHRDLAERGLWAGGPRPYGYEVVPTVGGFTLEPIEAEADVVRTIVTRVLGGESLRRIARDLDAAGVASPGGGCWYASTVRDMAASPRYAALREHNGQVVGPAVWPAIIDPADHAAVVSLFAQPSRKTTTTSVRARLLSGVAVCGVCHARVISGATSATGRPTYRCPSRAHFCRSSATVDEFISAVMVARLKRPDALAALAREDAPNLAVVVTKADKVRARLADLATAYGDNDDMSPAEYKAATSRLRERLAALDEQAASMTGNRAPVLAMLDPSDADAAWLGLPLADQRALVGLLAEIRLHPVGQGRKGFDPATVQVLWH